MKRATLFIISAAFAVMLAAPAFGAQLFNDTFSYADGDLQTVSGGVWVVHSGTASPQQVISGKVNIIQGVSGGEDTHAAFAQQGVNDMTYACFELTVPSQTNPVPDSRYFLHFRTDGNFNFRARTFVSPAMAGGDFTVAIDNDDSTADTFWGSDLSFDTAYEIVIKYDAAANSATLWVNPVSEASTSITSSDATGGGVDALDRISIRQDSGGNVTMILDDVSVGQTFQDVCDGATPTQNTSWGRMKALYR